MVLFNNLWRKKWKSKRHRPRIYPTNGKNRKLGKKKITNSSSKHELADSSGIIVSTHSQESGSTNASNYYQQTSIPMEYSYGAIHTKSSALLSHEQGGDYNQVASLDEAEAAQTLPSMTSDFRPDDSSWWLARLIILYVSTYLGIAVLAYSYGFEQWKIIDSLYFATNLFTTVGQSDLEPTTDAGQLFTVFFSVYGVIILGVFVGIIGHSVSEGQLVVVSKIKLKTRTKILKTMIESAEQQQQQSDSNSNQSKRRNTKDTKPVQQSKAAATTAAFWDDYRALWKDIMHVLKMEFPELAILMVFAFILGYREGWSHISTLYFCIMSASTTGFGSFVPKSDIDKLYCVFFLPFSVAVFGEVLGRIATVYLQRKTRERERAFLQQSITLCDLRRMDANNDGGVDMEEWLTFMLVALQKVELQDIEDLKGAFYALDANGNGLLEKSDLVAFTNQSSGSTAWSQLEDKHADPLSQ